MEVPWLARRGLRRVPLPLPWEVRQVPLRAGVPAHPRRFGRWPMQTVRAETSISGVLLVGLDPLAITEIVLDLPQERGEHSRTQTAGGNHHGRQVTEGEGQVQKARHGGQESKGAGCQGEDVAATSVPWKEDQIGPSPETERIRPPRPVESRVSDAVSCISSTSSLYALPCCGRLWWAHESCHSGFERGRHEDSRDATQR